VKEYAMTRESSSLLGLFVALALFLPAAGTRMAVVPPSVGASTSSHLVTADAHNVQADVDWGRMSVYFIENQGQLDERVLYYIQGRDKMLYFTSEGVIFALTAPSSELSAVRRPKERGARDDLQANSPGRWAIKLDFLGANSDVRPEAEGRRDAVVSYFTGRHDRWHTDLPSYTRLVYRDLWPGIDLVYYGTVDKLKYEFIVQPGADPAQIRLAYRGADVTLNAKGQLVVATPVGGFSDDAPVAYQDIGGKHVSVSMAYQIFDVFTLSALPSTIYGFSVGAYDATRPLVLDPAVLVYCGYIGGSHDDSYGGIAVDGEGNAYVTGSTQSVEDSFPVTVGPDLTFNGDMDAFVAKVDVTGTDLLYAGYIGGDEYDSGADIAVDSVGNAYVVGVTTSTETSFPVAVGPDLTYNGGMYDAFVAQVDATGTNLIYCGYIGGDSLDRAPDIAVDSMGNAYITGQTGSSEASFPLTVGPDLTFNGGYYDAFVAKVNASGSGLVYCGYIGGNATEWGQGIAVDGAGNAYITGETVSTEDSFPVTVGPDLTFNGGYNEAYVAKVNTAGTGFDYVGYIGGNGSDRPMGIAVDSAGNAYVTGDTDSTETSFPVKSGPDLTFNGGYSDAFVAKVSVSGSGLDYCGYIGGDGSDYGYDIAADNAGSAYVTGRTSSTEVSFPVANGPDSTYNGGNWDAFVAKVGAANFHLVYAGYIGGNDSDFSNGIAVDRLGNAYVTGSTRSTEASFPVILGPDLTHNGGDLDAFLAKVGGGFSVYLPLILRSN
jgi:hypothetical protein